MQDFIKPKEIREISPKEAKEAQMPESQVEIENQEQDLGKNPEFVQETAPITEELPDQTGKIISIEDRIKEQNPATKTEFQQDIEKRLCEDLEDVYASLDSSAQEKVKIDGEKTANEIEKLLEQKIQEQKDVSKKVLEKVRQWMHKIPGVNKFFLEQESKRKTDYMLGLAKKSQQEVEKVEIKKAA